MRVTIQANDFKAGNNKRIKKLEEEIKDINNLSKLKQRKKTNKQKIQWKKAQIEELKWTNKQIINLSKDNDNEKRKIKKLLAIKANSQYKYRININEIINERFNNTNAFRLNGVIEIEGLNIKIKTGRFFKDGEELGFYIDSILDKYEDIPNVTFTGDLYIHYRNFREVKRSDYGKGASEFHDIVEYKGLCSYIPTGNGCFLKCINYIYNKDFTDEYYTFLKSFKRQTDVMLKARVSLFCKRVGIDIGFWSREDRRIMPRSCTERSKCLYLHKQHYCVIWKNTDNDSLINAAKEVEDNFQYIRNRINNNNLKNVIKYSFPFKEKHSELDNVFIFDIETANVDDKAIPYGIGLFDLSRLKYRYKKDLTDEEIVTEREKVIKFKAYNGNPVVQMIEYINKNYTGDKIIHRNKSGANIVKSYRITLVAHNSSAFDSYIILNNLLKNTALSSKIVRTDRGIIKLQFNSGKINNTPQYIKIVCSGSHIAGSLADIGREYGVQPQLLKSEMDHGKITMDNYKSLENEWVPYLELDCLSLAYVYARHVMEMKKISNVSVKQCLTEAALGWSILGTYIKDKEFYTSNDKYVRHFIRRSIYGGRVIALKKRFISREYDNITSVIMNHFNCIEQEAIPTYLKYIKSEEQRITEDINNELSDYRELSLKQTKKEIMKRLHALEISKKIKKVQLNDYLVSSDYTSLYPSAQADPRSIWPKIETSYAFEDYMNDSVCSLFNNKKFEELNLCCFLTVKYHNHEDLIFQHLPARDRVQIPYKNNTYEDMNRARNGVIIATLTSIDIIEIVKTGGVILKVYEGFFCESLDFNPYSNFVLDTHNMRNEYKKKGNDLSATQVKKVMCSVYGGNVRKDILDKYVCVSDDWMDREYDKSVKEIIPLENETYVIKKHIHEGKDDFGLANKINTMPCHMGSYILSHSKRLMNEVIEHIGGFYKNNIYYTDTDSIYIHKNDFNILKKDGFIEDTLGKSKNDYGENGGILKALFIGPKMKYCLVIDDGGYLCEKITFKGLEKGSSNIKYTDFVNLARGRTITNVSMKKWEKKLDGIKIPHRRHGCNKCDDSLFCDRCQDDVLNCHECEKLRACKECYDMITVTKKYTSNINECKRLPENNDGDMLAIYVGKYQKEYNDIDTKQAIEIISPPRIFESEERPNQIQECLTIIDTKKKCNTCNIELNDQNKIKNKRICKQCNNEQRRRKRERGQLQKQDLI